MSEKELRNELPPYVFTQWGYLDPIREHTGFILVFIISATISALILTYVYSEKYEATTSMVFSPEEVTRLRMTIQQAEAFGGPMPVADFKVIGKTLEERVKNERLLRRIVDDFDLDVAAKKTYEGPWYVQIYEITRDYGKEYALKAWSFLKYGRIPEKDPTGESVLDLAANIDVINNDSYVFYIRVRDKEPRRAAAIADALGQGLLDSLAESYRDPVVDQRTQIAILIVSKQQEIRTAQDEIEDLLGRYEISSVSEDMSHNLEQLYELEAEQMQLTAQIVQSERRIASIDEMLALKSGPGGSKGRIQPDDFKKLASESVFEEVELAALRSRHDSILTSIKDLGARVRELPRVKLRIEQLETDLARANEEYNLLSVALQEALLQELGTISELEIQHPAAIPTAPVTPIKIYHTGLAAILAVFVAVGLVYVLAFFNIRVFSESRGVAGRKSVDADSPVNTFDSEQTAVE